MLQEYNTLKSGSIGKMLYKGENDLVCPFDQLDIGGLCHVLRYSPSMGYAGNPVWTLHDDELPFVAVEKIVACAIIKEIRNKIHGHSNKIMTLSGYDYVVNMDRLLQNLMVLGCTEEELRKLIENIELKQECLASEEVGTAASAHQAARKPESAAWKAKTTKDISDTLVKIFLKIDCLDVLLYFPYLQAAGLLTTDDVDQIDTAKLEIQKQQMLITAIARNNVEGVKALYEVAKKNSHYEMIEMLKSEFGFD